MNEQVRNILEQSTTKTSKIEQLLRLGLMRREIADLVTRGNYGFVYNVAGLLNKEIMNYENWNSRLRRYRQRIRFLSQDGRRR